MTFVLAIDQGTTSSRAILFDQDMKICGISKRNLRNIFRILAGSNMMRLIC